MLTCKWIKIHLNLPKKRKKELTKDPPCHPLKNNWKKIKENKNHFFFIFFALVFRHALVIFRSSITFCWLFAVLCLLVEFFLFCFLLISCADDVDALDFLNLFFCSFTSLLLLMTILTFLCFKAATFYVILKRYVYKRKVL